MISPASIDAAIARSFAADAPITSVEGDDALIHVAIPEMSPPPPTDTTTASGAAPSSRISFPIVPCPAMMRGSLYGET